MTTLAPVNQRATVQAVRKGVDVPDYDTPGAWGFYSVDGVGDRAGLLFGCPCGCGSLFSVAVVNYLGSGPVWQWDGNEERPTVTPSILVYQMDDNGQRIGEHWHGFLTEGVFRSC